MAEPADIERRLTSLESRLEDVATDAAAARRDAVAARYLAAAHDLADLGVKVDANRRAINALGIQTVARFDRVEQRLDDLENKVDTGFAEMRAKFDQSTVGNEQIVHLLDHVIARFESK